MTVSAAIPCPCGSGNPFESCCAPLLAGAPASGPEALMRSRYTAFTRADVDYLDRTLAPDARDGFDRGETETWAKEADWRGLEVLSATTDEAAGRGTVEFVARYRFRGQIFAHHELASFALRDGRWSYVDGVINPKAAPRTAKKVGRNDPCPCGSGRKYKTCCGA
jgi:SEC-C motif-containing protein